MKKFLILLISSLLLVACELEISDNGQLDGNWQLRQVDTLATGGITNMSQSYIYWAVQNDLLQVRDIDSNNIKIFFRFDRQAGTLVIHSPYLVSTKDQLFPIENGELLKPLGITGIEDRYVIETLNSSHLTLRNELYRLHFRRY